MKDADHTRTARHESVVDTTSLAAFKQDFDPILGSVFRKHLAEIRSTTEDPYLDEYLEYLTETFAVYGKRIRPFVLNAMYRAVSGKVNKNVLMYSVGVELFHTFCLIHDDIIDNGTVRHRQPTLHIEISRRMSEAGRVGDVAQLGQGQAMLVGDLVFFWAHQRLTAAEGFSEQQRQAACSVVKNMVEDVVIGQMVDVDAMSRQAVTSEIVTRKTKLKTAGYTFTRPMQLGVALAGGSAPLMVWCESFGDAIGEAFQTLDDLKDLVGDPAKGTQARFSDIREHQHTFFTQHVFDHGTPAQRRKLSSWLGSPIAEPEAPAVAELFETTGALAAGKAHILKRLDDSETLLVNAPGGIDLGTGLSDLVESMRARLK